MLHQETQVVAQMVVIYGPILLATMTNRQLILFIESFKINYAMTSFKISKQCMYTGIQ